MIFHSPGLIGLKLTVKDLMCSDQSLIKARTTPQVQAENLYEDWQLVTGSYHQIKDILPQVQSVILVLAMDRAVYTTGYDTSKKFTYLKKIGTKQIKTSKPQFIFPKIIIFC